MAGARIELDSKDAHSALGKLLGELENPTPMLQQIREYLLRIHQHRFKDQKSPDGVPWAPLSPRYQKRKHKNRDKILTFRGYLRNTLAGVIDDNELAFGTNRIYGAIHQFGGDIKHRTSTRDVFFKMRNGVVGNRFVKKSKSNFAQTVNVKEHTTKIPARPWLGTSAADDDHILEITRRWLAKVATP